MANTIKQKRGTSDPGASDLVVGELAINTTDGGVFTKTDGGTVVEVGAGGASELNDLSDAVTNSSGATIGLGTGALSNDDGSTNKNTAVGNNALNTNTSGALNTAVGYQALEANTSGDGHTAVGYQAGKSITTALYNTFVGYGSFTATTTGQYNAGLGFQSGLRNTTGTTNTAVGYNALTFNATGSKNTVIGYQAVYGSSGNSNEENTAVGYQAGYSLSTGSYNVMLGYQAGNSITTGTNNLVLGYDADASSATATNEITLGNSSISSLRIPGIDLEAESGVLNIKNGGTQSEVRWYCESSNAHYAAIKAPAHSEFSGNITFTLPATTGSNGQVLSTDGSGALSWVNQSSGGGGASAINDLSDAVTKDGGITIGLGTGALANDDDTDNKNTALGYNALNTNTSGSENTALGYKALEACTSGGHNTCLGQESGDSITSAFLNTYVGSRCGRNNTTSSNNTGVGFMALEQLTTGQSNTAIGQRAGDLITTGINLTCIGNGADPSSATASNEITLGNSSISTLRCNTQTISSLSDARDKTDVQELPEGLDFISKLNPVKFQWQTRDGNGKDGTYEAGFIAQELQSAQQGADADYLGLVMDSNPDRLEASYGKLVPMLVKAIQELKSEVEQLKANV